MPECSREVARELHSLTWRLVMGLGRGEKFRIKGPTCPVVLFVPLRPSVWRKGIQALRGGGHHWIWRTKL